MIRLLEPFGTIFQAKTWEKAQLLLVGAILSPGKRTVTSALRVMGLSRDGNFARYHHVLNRARWSSLQLSRTLLFLLLRHLDSGIGPLVFGIDETIERRRSLGIRPLGEADFGQRHLPRWGPFQPGPFRKSQRVALG